MNPQQANAQQQTRADIYQPLMTNAGLQSTSEVVALNEFNEPVDSHIAVERALTVYLDKREVVTLMTLGKDPELLVLGWLRNQRLVTDIEQVKAIQVDWVINSERKKLNFHLGGGG